jgi:hypothetical protein
MGREWSDAGEVINCETLRPDAHNQTMSLLVHGDQPVFTAAMGTTFGGFGMCTP